MVCLTTKIFRPGRGCSPLTEGAGKSPGCALGIGLTNDTGNAATRLRKFFLFMDHATAIPHIGAIAQLRDFVIPHKRLPRPPLSRELSLTGCWRGGAWRSDRNR